MIGRDIAKLRILQNIAQISQCVPKANARPARHERFEPAIVDVILLVEYRQVFRAGGLLGGVFLPVFHPGISQHQFRLKDAELPFVVFTIDFKFEDAFLHALVAFEHQANELL